MSILDLAMDELESGAENAGICLSCRAVTSGVEPDASGYECPSCGEMRVAGCEEIIVCGGAI